MIALIEDMFSLAHEFKCNAVLNEYICNMLGFEEMRLTFPLLSFIKFQAHTTLYPLSKYGGSEVVTT